MKDLSRNGYTHEEIKNMLHMVEGSREIAFRYDLVDRFGNKKAELDNITDGQVSFDAFNTIKRTASFTLREFTYKKAAYMGWDKFGYLNWSDLENAEYEQS